MKVSQEEREGGCRKRDSEENRVKQAGGQREREKERERERERERD